MVGRIIAVALICLCPVAAAGDETLAKSLAPAEMLKLAPKERGDFVIEWDRRLRDALASLPDDESRTDAATRLRFRHAQGRAMYPFFHWRESAATAIEPDPDFGKVLSALPSIDARLWEFPEVRDFVDAHLQGLARTRLAEDADLRYGDARWLRAKLKVLETVLPDPGLWMRKATDLIVTHVEDDGAAGIEEAIRAWHSRSPPPESRQRVEQVMAADRAHAEGVQTFTYREVAGVPLRLFVLRAKAGRGPAMLWLHGGSATEGTWWHSPGITQALRNSGITVIGVELTTANRFDRDADPVSDAAAAYEFVRANARRMGVQPRRIGVAGFSSGATLALLLATRGVAPAAADNAAAARSARPAAVIVSGACADPLSAGSDGYFRKSIGATRDPADLSPIARVRRGGPPILAIHGTRDEYCPFADIERFADQYRAAGNRITLVRIDGARHFFGFHHEDGKRRQAAAISEAIDRWDW